MYAFRSSASRSILKAGTRLSSSGPAQVKRINVIDFDKILKSKDNRAKYQIIDVREKDELALAHIPGDDIVNLPLRDIDNWKNKVIDGDLLEQSKPTLVMCHHGMRSMRVATFLVNNAEFTDVSNVEGGIAEYAGVDPTVGSY